MSLYIFLRNLLSVLLQIANETGLQKKSLQLFYYFAVYGLGPAKGGSKLLRSFKILLQCCKRQQLFDCLLMCNFERICSSWHPKIWQICVVLKFNTCFIIGSKFKKYLCQPLRLFWYISNFAFKGIYIPTDSMWINIWKVIREPLYFHNFPKTKLTLKRQRSCFVLLSVSNIKSFDRNVKIFSLAEIILMFFPCNFLFGASTY
jgi:hypothetical protein